MSKTRIPCAALGLLMVLALLVGCTLRAAPDVTPTPSEMDRGMIELATQAAATAAAPVSLPPTPTMILILPTATPTVALEPTATPEPFFTPTPTPVPTQAVAGTTQEQSYTVQQGDTLYSIARRYGLGYLELASYNNIVNPNLIRVGQVLRIPAAGTVIQPQPAAGTTYVVQPGDNLFRIALRYNMSYLYLASYNGIANPNAIYAGQVLRIPPTP
jgi:LysM repeat protein